QVYRPFYQVPPRRSVTVTAGAPQDLGITKLTSTVAYFGKVSGVVKDVQGLPLDGAVAQLDPPVTDSQFTDATGKFTLDRILPGEYQLTIAAGGLKPVIVPVMVDNKPNFTVTLPEAITLTKGSAKTEPPVIKPLEPVPAAPPPSAPPASAPPTPTAPASATVVATPVATTVATPLPAPSSAAPKLSPPVALKGEVSTLAGSKVGGANGKGASAQFYAPGGIALAPDGVIYVADTGSNRIRKVMADGMVTLLAGMNAGLADGTGQAAQFSQPEGLGVDAKGNLYVADSGNCAIRVVTPTGAVTTLAGDGTPGANDGVGKAARFTFPKGLAVTPDGTVFVADQGNQRIRKITPDGTVSTVAGSSSGYVEGPASAAKFWDPSGITVSPDGTLYVTELGNHCIRKITPSGTVSTLAGSPTQSTNDGIGAAAGFSFPEGIHYGHDGYLYVADTNHHRIRRVSAAGEVVTLGGSWFGMVDGKLGDAKFGTPGALVLAKTGEIYVADTSNHRVRVIR
ncbi:MAG: carboxypeptidase regulatory-like domain-containing protein, partial [Candidatus Sericytochromatia bacterium]|nr:carboxypeptidase regulatory-like domain-containing protein [Candidatus Sericytochromatia bacterium]